MSTAALDPAKATPEDVFTKASLRKMRNNVTKGARLLDRSYPDWYKSSNVALSKLNMDDCETCVLGQLYGDYSAGLVELDIARGPGGGISRETSGFTFGFDSSFHANDFVRRSIPIDDGWPPKEGEFTGLTIDTLVFEFFSTAWEAEIRSRRNTDSDARKGAKNV